VVPEKGGREKGLAELKEGCLQRMEPQGQEWAMRDCGWGKNAGPVCWNCQAGLGGPGPKDSTMFSPNPRVGIGSSGPFVSRNVPSPDHTFSTSSTVSVNQATLIQSLRGQRVSVRRHRILRVTSQETDTKST
jgi:hypothetical protein